MIELGFKGSDDPDNKFRFKCPVVKIETKLLDCYERRHGYMRAKILDRADCRCALTGSKCPARRMLDEEYRTGRRIYFDPIGKELKPLPKTLLEEVERIILVASQADGQPLTPEEAATLGVRQRQALPPTEEEFEAAPAKPAKAKPAAPSPSIGGYRTQADMCRSLIKEGLSDTEIFDKVREAFPTFKKANITYYREQVGEVAPVTAVKTKSVIPKTAPVVNSEYPTQAAMCRALIAQGDDDETIGKKIRDKFPTFKLSNIAYYRLHPKS